MPQTNVRSPRSSRPAAIGQRIRRRRVELGLSQNRVAEAARIGRRTLQRIEAGELPSAETVWRLETALSLESGSLVPGWDVTGSLHGRSVGARIRERRQACGHSLTKTADWIGISAAALSRFERGIPRFAGTWHPIIDHRLAWILGFMHADRLEEWIHGERDDPPIGIANWTDRRPRSAARPPRADGFEEPREP